MDSIPAFEENPSVSTAWAMTRDCIRHPQLSFLGLPLRGPWIPGLVFAVVVGSIVWTQEVVELGNSIAGLGEVPQFREAFSSFSMPGPLKGLGAAGGAGSWIFLWITGIPFVLMGLASSILSLHLCLRVCSAGNGGLIGTSRVLSYTGTGALLAIVPYVGGLLSMIIASIQIVVGLTRVHETSTGRVLFAMSLPLILAAVALALITMMMMRFMMAP